MMKVRLERSFSMDGYEASVWTETAPNKFSVAKLAHLEFQEFEHGQAVLRGDFEGVITRHNLRTLYDSLKEEMIRLGVIPRPLAEEEVCALKEQLKDVQKTRDELLKIIQTIGHAAVLKETKQVTVGKDIY